MTTILYSTNMNGYSLMLFYHYRNNDNKGIKRLKRKVEKFNQQPRFRWVGGEILIDT